MKKNLIIKNDKMNILFLLFFGENIIQSFIIIVKERKIK
jgi:hypothetical protein